MPAETLDLPARRALYQHIRDQPGLHQRELQRVAGLATGALEYHLRVLEQEGLVSTRDEANRKRYFPSDMGRADKDLLKVLRPRPTRRIVLALLEHPELSLTELAGRIGLAPSSAHAHVKRLLDAGILDKRREGGTVRLRVKDAAACVRALVTFRPTLVDRAVDRFLETFGALEPTALRSDPLHPGGAGPADGRGDRGT